MLREARVIIPQFDNNGNSLHAVKEDVAKLLCETFGGLSLTAGHGYWVNPEGFLFSEPVWFLDVACIDNKDTVSRLYGIAQHIAVRGDQECVYLRLPSGDVRLVYPPLVPAVEAALSAVA